MECPHNPFACGKKRRGASNQPLSCTFVQIKQEHSVYGWVPPLLATDRDRSGRGEQRFATTISLFCLLATAFRSDRRQARRPISHGTDAFKMIPHLRQIVLLLAPALLAYSLSGCASMNERAAAALGDYVPQWAGGMPPDAPPRPGTAKYDEWMKERERQRLLPADQRDKAAPAATSSSAASAPSSTGSISSNASASSPGLPPPH